LIITCHGGIPAGVVYGCEQVASSTNAQA